MRRVESIDEADDTASADRPPSDEPSLEAGTKVCVWNRSLDKWSGGFEIVQSGREGYRLKRSSDGRILDDVVEIDQVRADMRRSPKLFIMVSDLDRRRS